MRPPTHVAVLVLVALSCACNSEPEPATEHLEIHLDERSVWVGEVVERLDGVDYVYLQLAVRGQTNTPAATRWIALDARARAPRLGERIQVRSLARRTRVWAASLERDFDTLDYAALME